MTSILLQQKIKHWLGFWSWKSSGRQGLRSSGVIEYWPFWVVTIMGAALRIVHLDTGMWYDELFVVQNYLHSPTSEIMKNFNCHILYTLLEKSSVWLLGESEWSLRLPALLMGIATIPFTHFLSGRIIRSRAAVFAGSLLLAFSMWHIWFSQGARGYSGMMLFCLASHYLYLRMHEEPNWRQAVLYVLSISAATYFQPFSIYTLGAHIMVTAAIDMFHFKSENRPMIAAMAAASVLIAILYLPATSHMLHMAGGELQNNAGREMNLRFIMLMPAKWAGWKEHPLFGMGLFIFALIGVGFKLKKRPLIAIVVLLPLVLALLFTWAGGMIAYYRYFSFFLPWYYLFAGLGINVVSKCAGKWRGPVFAASLILLLSINAKPLYDYYKLGKQPFIRVAAWAEKLPPEIQVYSFGLTEAEFCYYSKRAKMIPHTQSIEPLLPGGGVFVSSYPFSWYRSDTAYLLEKCWMKVWPAAGKKSNAVYVFTCPATR